MERKGDKDKDKDKKPSKPPTKPKPAKTPGKGGSNVANKGHTTKAAGVSTAKSAPSKPEGGNKEKKQSGTSGGNSGSSTSGTTSTTSTSKVVCYKCNQSGHYKNECPNKTDRGGNSGHSSGRGRGANTGPSSSGGRGGQGGRGGRGGRGGGNNVPSRGGGGQGRGGGRGGSNGANPRPVKPDAVKLQDCTKFIRSCTGDPQKLDAHLRRFVSEWLACWNQTDFLPFAELQKLIVTLASIPFSSNIPHPPIRACCLGIERLLFESSQSDDQPEEFNLRQVETVINACNRLIKFQWTCPQEEVKSSIDSALCTASSILNPRIAEHRKAQGKINIFLEDLEKPWTIKTKDFEESTEISDLETVVTPKTGWKHATVRWLMDGNNFLSPVLPKMRVPGDKHGGTFQSPDEYYDIVHGLWVGMTWCDGWQALSPFCKWRNGEQDCSHVLWPASKCQGGEIRCSRKNCTGIAAFVCPQFQHRYGLCEGCANSARKYMQGPPGPHASTDIYDGKVGSVDWEGKIMITQVDSRRPPLRPIHWKTTRRLSVSSLVGLVKLSSRGSVLSPDLQVIWAEVVLHDRSKKPFEEVHQREKQKLAVTLLDLDQAHEVEFVKGDHIAIIDCQTFVPEHIPILKALETQRQMTLPFNNGQMLNIGAVPSSVELGPLVRDPNAPIVDIIELLVDTSALDPIVQLRRLPSLRSTLISRLTDLVKAATLDVGQLESFVASMSHEVHCTQGPPGTGKSYLGVAITRALLIVRDLWTQACPHVGTPPILVLSYKNHAIDEFLVDLVRAVPAVKMIRVGSQSTEPLLQRFMERTRVMSDVTVQSEYQKIQHIYSFRQILQSFSEDHSKLRLHRANILGEQPTDEQEKKALKHETYAAVQIFANVLHRISYLITQSESNGTLSDDEKKVKEIASGVQKSVMQAASSYGSLNKLKSGLAQIPSKMEASTLVISLAEGIKHYGIKDIHEILLRWMQGFVPRPPCPFDDCKRAALLGNKYCHKHSCCFVIDDKDNQCRKRVVVDKALCVDHACEEYDCLEAKLNEKQKFCHLHACVKCLEAGEIAGVAYDDPPRNTCEKHPLCQKVIKGQACDKLAVLGSFCDAHGLKCRATTAKGRPCMARPMSTENPYCKDHQPRAPARVAASTTTTSSGKCAAITKKGQPCKGTAISGMSYCRDHLSLQAKTVAIIEQPIFTKETAREEAASGEPTETETPTEEEVKEGEAEAEADAEKTPYNSFDDESDDGGVVDRDRNYTDNVDEIDMEDDESDYLQHLRDVGDVEEKEELCFHQDEVQPEIKDTSTPTTENATWVLPSLWSWKMSLDERWEIIFDTLELESKLSAVIDEVLLREFTITRRDYKTAKVKANARVYEGMEVIGGTIVGCVTRLEAIRGTNPFAILVEEASEVLEPLLFSCIVPSTVKLEMIGDHRQLQPSMMGKFDFERINKMNMSLFERLIRAPPQYAVPSSVLSVQRRMRPNICDLTRDFYFDITNIEDHSVCAVKKIKRVLPLSFSKKDLLTDTEGEGREVPGVLPHIYFWTHAGKQERASVGLSKENKQEADMVCKLAEYLVACGVPKTSIAVLTPYKGQLMLLRKLLMKQGILAGAKSSDPQNTCRVSTVDRFQGDEADVVIISLVIDANSKTPFVKLVNRMIVLLSRARIGMYIVGNVGYFEDQKSTAEHWRKVFLALKEPAASDTLQTEATCETFSGTRIGSALPICCPRHRNSVFSANTPNQLKLGFCTVRCQQTLPNCQHECGLACHWPTDSHNKKCSILVEVPCATHPEKVPCHELTRTTSLARALANYKCTKKVDVQMPCGHITTFPCHESVALASGAMPWPKCEHAAHLPFVLPGCKHETAVKCWQYALYTSSPSSIPPCQKKVDYYPACGHSVQVLCTTKQQYDLGKIVFMCKTMVDRELPRCSHTAQMPCVNATQLDSWTGQSCEEVGIVREGTSYGEKDHTCKKVVKFIRLCGHQETHPCERAFELAKNPTKCNVKEAIVNPICGHEGTILCHQKKLLSGLSRDGLSPVSVVDETNPGAGYLKPQGISIPCTHHVKLQRACGHVAMVECSKARGTKTACEVPKTIKSPLCGHDISAPCSLGKAIEEWQPWHEDFLKSLDGTSLMSEGIFSESSPKPEAAPSALIGRLPKCNQDLVFRRTCGHEVVMKCDKVFHSKSIASLGKCQDAVKKTMFCGHMRDFKCWQYQEYFKNPASMPCHEIVPKQCWNFECCSSIVSSPCITGFIQCDAESEWKCKQGHIFKFRQCKDGQPSACPDCILSKIDEELEKVTSEEYSIELKQDLPPILTGINGITVVPLPMTARDASEFRERVPFVLETYKKWCSEVQNPWDRPIFKRLTPLPCFTTFPQQRGNQQPKRPLSPATANVTTAGHAIRCSEWTKSNLQRFLSGMNSPSVTIAFGYGYSYKALINPSIPNNKKAKTKWIERLPDQAIDTIRMNNGDLIFLDPFLVSASHKITVTQEALKLLISRMPDGCVDLSSNHITFKIPDEAKSTISSFAPPGQATPTEALVGTLASGLAIVLNWDGLSFGTSACRLGEAIEKEMQKKVCYARSVFDTPVNDNPMGSINFLKKLLESGYFEVHLHLALECLQDEWDGAFNKLATESLGKYIREVKAKKALAHPLLLVAIARLEKNPIHVQNCLKSFTTYYSAATKWLTKKETMLLSDQPAVLPVQNQAPSPKELWEDLKAKEGRQSKAMEELLKLTGLKKVKESAIKMFKAALALMKLSPDARKKNMGSLNFAFLGNPGTGKTTVARLFAEILKDSGMRPKGTFIECTAQELKDEGPDKFRAKIAAAKDGVLFIDEAYDLDPFGDFKGKPIVAELLTAAENKRDELSIILAGYQDDMNEKFFKFNDGLKSRFAEVMFEDFEEPELREIWRHILSEKGFVADDKLGDIVSKRLARRANRKGFGNARDVRRVAEDAINTAMSRENFRGDNLEILMEDVVGECPANNPKINAILAELEGQIGWKKIKESIYEMVSLAQQNYERELQGTAPLPFPLHKMFLGNPGTGKTTCAKLYGRFLKAIGILSIGEVVCKTASDFVGQYVGQSSQKTNDILKAAQGKVLVIDEAYALNDQNYGKQVIDTLVEKVQGSHDDFAVLLLGYEKQMLEMIREQNPGLARRFPEQYAFYFEDYTPQELLKIFFSTCKRNHVSGSSEKVVEKVLQVLGRQRSLPNFGNAGTVNQIVENAAKKAAARQAAEGRIGAAIELEVSDIEGEDVEEKKDPLAPLDDLFNVDNIKKKLQQLQNGLKVAKMDGDATPDIGHFVFRGPPGTGKTTVARVMAEILFHMELLATKRCVETSGVNLTGEYLGQTKKKVTDKLGEAKGGVLFIDEAYKLGEGPYGEEALVTILEAMTSPDYKGLVIIIAGYEQDIEKMLARNAGLKSRFTQFFDFEDWTPADCVKFFMQQATKKCFVIDEDAAEILPKIFAKLIQAPGWANGRDVGQFLKKVEAHRADRVASSPTPDLVKTIVLSDVEKGIEEMMKIRDINAAPNSPPNWAIPQLQLQQQPQSQPLQQVQRQQQQYQQQQQVQQQQQQRQEQPEPKEEEAHHPEHKHYGRDAGVTDEQWEELEKAKKEHEAKLERLKKEKAETELREELKKQQALQDALRKIAKCPAGFEWFKVGGGWRCGGGSHFVTDAELASKFSYL